MKPALGDYVTTPAGGVHWRIIRIESEIDPLGVVLISGMTGRVRRDTYSNLTLFRKGTKP